MRRIFPLAIFVMALLTGDCVRAQSANPLAAPTPPNRFGADIGLNINQQSGSFNSDCGCEFPSGAGTGFFVSGIAEMHLNQTVALMAKLSINNITLTSKALTSKPQTVVLPDGIVDSSSIIDMNETAVTRLTYLQITPMVRYDVFKRFFVAFGPSVGIAIGNGQSVDESVAKAGYGFWPDGSTTRTLHASSDPVASLSAIRFSLVGTLGYEFDITPKWSFVPTASVDFPLTNVTSGSTWKIMSFQIAGGVRWKVHV